MVEVAGGLGTTCPRPFGAIGCADVLAHSRRAQSNPPLEFDPAQIHGVKQNRPHKAACSV